MGVNRVGEISHPADNMLSDWLERLSFQAGQHPEQVAVLGNEISLTRGGLDKNVAALTRQLDKIGITPGDPVAVCLDRSPFTIVAFLAVLRVGGTYLPIDAQYPAVRVTSMLECKPGAIITTESIHKSLPELRCPIIFATGNGDDQDVDSPGKTVPVSDDIPAYMMFTSGSTGKANGVVVSRGALARYAAALRDAIDISEKDVYLHSASFSFSASIRQIVAPLTAGAAMIIADEEARHDPYRLLELMNDRQVTVWDTVPSLWGVVERVLSSAGMQDGSVSITGSLRFILLTGESLSWGLVSAWKKYLGRSVNIVNLYSQTETAGTVSMFPIPGGEVPETGMVPLGKPLADVALLVLGEDLKPVTLGHEGEIYVASNRLAQGYQGDEELTVSRFLPEFDVNSDYQRVYRTGDFVHMDADGSLIPVGRRDHRVKIRGFRVDLQEIETELLIEPSIKQVIVLVEASTRLVAYVVPTPHEQLVPEDLLNGLRDKLLPHSVPSQIVIVDQFPISPNGKVDRVVLAQQRAQESSVPADVLPALDQTEQKLLKIWEKSLAYRGASINDDFFENGGDSLTAVSLFLDIEQHFGIRLPPSTLLTVGTVGSLAATIRSTPRITQTQSVLELRKGGSLPPLFLVHAIWEHIPHFKELVKLLDPELPVYALEPIRNTEVAGPDLDVAKLVKQYAREIRKKHPEGPYFLAGWSIGGFMAFSVAVELESRGDNPAGLILIDAVSPSMRPKIRLEKARGLSRKWAYLQKLVQRQIQSFQLTPREQLERLVWMFHEAGRRIGDFVARPANRTLRESLKEDIRRIVDQYQPPPYKGPAVLFRSEQPVTEPGQDHDLGWSHHIYGNLEIVPVPGDHVTIVIEPHNMKLLAERISAIVRREAVSEATRHQHGTGDDQSLIDLFLEESIQLTDREYTERVPWINTVSKDAIRHFAYGICDDNPLWTDENHSAMRAGGPLLAPPAMLVAARYPVLHGAPIDVPLISLLRDIEYTWERPVYEGERLQSSTRQGEVCEVVDPDGNRKVYIDGHTTYWNARDQAIGSARSTVVRMLSQGSFQVDDWSVYRYQPEELERIIEGIQAEARTGSRVLSEAEFQIGCRLPSIVRGPLTIGDLVCWHSAVGPSYRPGPLGYKDTLKMPQFRVKNPITGWPIKYMLHHEDVNLAHQRGMPAPFDNGVMRFAWVSPLITNWMGDEGFLARLHVKINLPFFYGDTCWYSGEVTSLAKERDDWRIGIHLRGTNQHGSITTTGSAEVLLPHKPD
jgi:amino acid adenylation domain-containing protein